MKQNASIPSSLLNFKKMEVNTVELLNKISQSANSNQDVVDINWIDQKGETTTYKYPVVGSVRNDVNSLRKTVESLINNNSNKMELEYSDGTVRQFKAQRYFDTLDEFSDMASSPLTISNYFRTKNNWFFESFLNPLLYINVDITSRVSGLGTTKFSVKRIILNNLTSAQINYWDTDIKNKSTWGLSELKDNLDAKLIEYFVDDNIIELPPVVNRYNGSFSVIQIVQETAVVNGVNIKKNYYKLDTLQYKDILNDKKSTRILAEEDVLITKNDSEYRIVSVDTKTNRVLLERIFGTDSIAQGTNVLKVKPQRYKVPYLQVNVGYNEREVIFIKPIDIDNNITTDEWSLGYPIFTNELIIKMNDNTELTLEEYYKMYVVDFGMLIMNLAKEKTVPTMIGLTPDAPVLDSSNFKIVRVNDHLKTSGKIETIKKKYAIKDKLNSDVQSIDKSIAKYRTDIQNPELNSEEKSRLQVKIEDQTQQKVAKTQQYDTTVKEISLGIKDSPQITIKNKYMLRGFWEIPDPKETEYGTQHVIQFIIGYRYLNSSGLSNNPEQIKYKNKTGTNTAYYSEWKEMQTILRKKAYDTTTGLYEWEDEDVANPEIINFNQGEISVTAGEQVEIRIKSVSEAGWPSNPLLSEWSDSVIISFPDNLIDSGNTENMINDIVADNAVVKTKEYYQSLGLDRVLASTTTVGDKTYVTDGNGVITDISDDKLNKLKTVNEVLRDMTQKISILENTISSDTGKLQVSFINDENTIFVTNGDTISTFAGYYKDIVENTADENGSVVSKSYTIVLENKSNTILELVARMSGGIGEKIGDDYTSDEDYNTNRIYHKTPIIISSTSGSDTGDFDFESPYQSSHVQSQYLFTRYKDYGLANALYASYGGTPPESPYSYQGFNVGSSNIPYGGFGHYLPYDPTFSNGGAFGTNQDVWDGTYTGSTPDGGGHLSEFCIHKDHPNVAAQSTLTFEDLARPAIAVGGEQQYLTFSHGAHFEISERENTNALGAKYYMQAEKISPDEYTGGTLTDQYYPVKMSFAANDEYLIGKYTCGAYLFIAPHKYEDISVEGNHPTLATKKIEMGAQNTINIPVLFQFRCVDRLGYIGGYRSTETLSNIKYTKKIGIDIYLRGTNPISYGEVFSFDIEASCQYKSGLNVIDPAYTPSKGTIKNLSLA